MRRIEIINNTSFRTRDLRRFVVRVAKDEAPDRPLRVTFYTTKRQGHCAGWAYYDSGTFRIGLPTAEKFSRQIAYHEIGPTMLAFWKQELARVIAHELAHCRGLTHRQMSRERYFLKHNLTDSSGLYDYAVALPLRLAEKKKAKPMDHTIKYAEKIKALDRRIKRLSTIRKKYAKRLKYHEKKMQIAADKAK